MFGTEQMPDIFWCETNAGHFLVRNKCRTFFGAEQIPDIFWCGPNAGPFLVRNKCRTLVGALVGSSIRYPQLPYTVTQAPC